MRVGIMRVKNHHRTELLRDVLNGSIFVCFGNLVHGAGYPLESFDMLVIYVVTVLCGI